MNHRTVTTAIITAIITLAITVSASAFEVSADMDYVNLTPTTSEEGAGLFDGELVLVHITPETARLIVNIRNHSSQAEGGYITGIAINNPSDQITFVRQTPESDFNENFEIIGENSPYNSVAASPFGLFDFGAVTGSTENGLAPDMGDTTHTFAFELMGDDLDTLSAADFLDQGSKRAGGEHTASFAVNFSGLNGSSNTAVALNII